MPRRLPGPLLIALAALAVNASCGKRADPLPPYLKTPLPPTGVTLSQTGDQVEIRVNAPTTTSEGRPLPVIELEWHQGPPTGDFDKGQTLLLNEEVAPGELRVKRFPRPIAPVRYLVRARNGNARSAMVGLLPFTPAPVPSPPQSLVATNTVAGIELKWTNPPGAEPWPTPTPIPTLTPAASPLASPGATPAASPAGSPGTPTPSPTPSPSPLPSPSPTPAPSPSPAPTTTSSPSPSPLGSPLPLASPSPSLIIPPTPPPTGIRVFRTDGATRLVVDHLQASTFADPGAKVGEKPCYSLRYATSFMPLVESVPTEPVCVEVKDLVPPEPPGRLTGDVGSNFVELSWLPAPSEDVAFYRLYRTTEALPRALVIQTEGVLLRVRDANMAPGPRTYEVTAVDKGGNESPAGPSLRLFVPETP